MSVLNNWRNVVRQVSFLFIGCAAVTTVAGQTAPSWQQFVADVAPLVAKGRPALEVHAVPKYKGVTVQWSGTLKSVQKNQQGSPVLVVGMAPQPVTLPGPTPRKSVVDFVLVEPDPPSAASIGSLQVGATLGFRGQLEPFVGLVPGQAALGYGFNAPSDHDLVMITIKQAFVATHK